MRISGLKGQRQGEGQAGQGNWQGCTRSARIRLTVHLLVGDHATIACNGSGNEARPMADERFVYPEMFKRVRRPPMQAVLGGAKECADERRRAGLRSPGSFRYVLAASPQARPSPRGGPRCGSAVRPRRRVVRFDPPLTDPAEKLPLARTTGQGSAPLAVSKPGAYCGDFRRWCSLRVSKLASGTCAVHFAGAGRPVCVTLSCNGYGARASFLLMDAAVGGNLRR